MTGRPASPEARQRAQAMFARWTAGETLKAIGTDYGITKAAVQQRMARAGLYVPLSRRSTREIVAEMLAMPRVARDPCPRCGVRGDVGCAHHASRLVVTA